MGKRNNNAADREVGENEEENSRRCCKASGVCNRSTLKLVVAVIVSVNILVFGVYNLPFFSNGRGHEGATGHKKAQVQASFMLRKPLPTISAHILELNLDIWDEIGIPDAKVRIISLRKSAESNSTKVVFGVIPSRENTSISSAGLSLLRETFVGLVSEQYNLSLRSSDIFGRAYFFQVLAFPGGITVAPADQKSFPLQSVQVLFNFTLANSIDQVNQNLAQLKQQLDIGLRVRSDENLFVQLTNLNGSTVECSIIVQTSIVPVVGSLTVPRLRQLAQEITGKHAGNLGLNHTLFGKVKQIKLSSYLKDPDSSSSSVPSPSPAPAHSTSSPTPAPVSNPYPAPSVPATAPSYHHASSPSNDNPPAHCHHHHDFHSSKCKHQHHARHAPASGSNGAPSPSPYIGHHVGVAPAPISITMSPSPPPPPQRVPPFKSPPCHSHRPYFPSISPSPSPGPSPSGFQFIPSPPVSPSHSPSHADISRPSSHIARPPSNSGTRVPSPKSSQVSPVTSTNVPPPESSRQPHSAPPQGNPPVSQFPRFSSASFDMGIPFQLIIHSTVFVGALLIYLL